MISRWLRPNRFCSTPSATKHSPSSQEFVFVLQEMGYPSRRADQYYARTPHGVELHLDIWDSDLDGIPLIPKLFSVERANVHHSNGFAFPALTDEDAFLLQVLHTCHHLFSQCVRAGIRLGRGADGSASLRPVRGDLADQSLRSFTCLSVHRNNVVVLVDRTPERCCAFGIGVGLDPFP